MGAEGWDGGGGCSGGVGRGGVCGVGVRGVGLTGAGGCYGAVLCGTCFRICFGAVFGLACVAVRGVGLRLLLGCCPRLDGIRYGCHGHRRADHGSASDHAEQVVKGSFHSGASR